MEGQQRVAGSVMIAGEAAGSASDNRQHHWLGICPCLHPLQPLVLLYSLIDSLTDSQQCIGITLLIQQNR